MCSDRKGFIGSKREVAQCVEGESVARYDAFSPREDSRSRRGSTVIVGGALFSGRLKEASASRGDPARRDRDLGERGLNIRRRRLSRARSLVRARRVSSHLTHTEPYFAPDNYLAARPSCESDATYVRDPTYVRDAVRCDAILRAGAPCQWDFVGVKCARQALCYAVRRGTPGKIMQDRDRDRDFRNDIAQILLRN